jgi:hypothetical protein
VLLDETGRNNAVASNGVVFSYANGTVGNGIFTDGTNDFIQMPVECSSRGLSKFTVTTWFRYASIKTTIVFFETIAAPSMGMARRNYQVTATGAILLNGRCADTDSSTSYAISATNIVTPNVWHHLAWVFDADTDNHCVYLDGRGVTLTRVAGTTISTDIPEVSPQALASTANSLWYSANLDEYRVYNVALTSAEVAQLYRMGATIFQNR